VNPLVETLADALVEHTTLSWQQVRRILQRAARNGGVDLVCAGNGLHVPLDRAIAVMTGPATVGTSSPVLDRSGAKLRDDS
jgi:hypothetical protein